MVNHDNGKQSPESDPPLRLLGRAIPTALEFLGPILAGFQAAAALVGYAGLGAFAKWVADNWFPFTRALWEKLISYLDLGIDLSAAQKDALTTAVFFLPMVIWSIFFAARQRKYTNPQMIRVVAQGAALVLVIILLLPAFTDQDALADRETALRKFMQKQTIYPDVYNGGPLYYIRGNKAITNGETVPISIARLTFPIRSSSFYITIYDDASRARIDEYQNFTTNNVFQRVQNMLSANDTHLLEYLLCELNSRTMRLEAFGTGWGAVKVYDLRESSYQENCKISKHAEKVCSDKKITDYEYYRLAYICSEKEKKFAIDLARYMNAMFIKHQKDRESRRFFIFIIPLFAAVFIGLFTINLFAPSFFFG